MHRVEERPTARVEPFRRADALVDAGARGGHGRLGDLGREVVRQRGPVGEGSHRAPGRHAERGAQLAADLLGRRGRSRLLGWRPRDDQVADQGGPGPLPEGGDGEGADEQRQRGVGVGEREQQRHAERGDYETGHDDGGLTQARAQGGREHRPDDVQHDVGQRPQPGA
nr:hypothetical protein [Streptomyces sp. PT12]